MANRVIRSCGPINDKAHKKEMQDQALKDSWDYWERRGLEHPMKRDIGGIKPLDKRSNEHDT